MLGSSGTGLLSSKHVRVGVPMLGAVLIGYVSLSSVLDGRIQVRSEKQKMKTRSWAAGLDFT